MEKSRELRFPTALAFREALEEIAPADAGRSSSTSHQRAQMPTKQISGAGGTAVVPSSDPANHFGVTTQMPRRSKRTPLAFGFGLVLAGAAVLALRTQNIAKAPSLPAEASVVNPMTPAPPPPAAPAAQTTPAAAESPAPAAVAAADNEPALAPRAAEAAAAPRPAVAATHAPVAPKPAHKPRKNNDHPAPGETTNAPSASPEGSAPAAPAVGLAASAPLAPPPEERTAPAQRGAREALTEGEKLLGQGEVRDACARGEEAKHLNPKLVAAYKFLGKCYMRAGNANQANDNYRKYLELSPNAPDAMFVKSMIK